jgi:hypothetical protein
MQKYLIVAIIILSFMLNFSSNTYTVVAWWILILITAFLVITTLIRENINYIKNRPYYFSFVITENKIEYWFLSQNFNRISNEIIKVSKKIHFDQTTSLYRNDIKYFENVLNILNNVKSIYNNDISHEIINSYIQEYEKGGWFNSNVGWFGTKWDVSYSDCQFEFNDDHIIMMPQTVMPHTH